MRSDARWGWNISRCMVCGQSPCDSQIRRGHKKEDTSSGGAPSPPLVNGISTNSALVCGVSTNSPLIFLRKEHAKTLMFATHSSSHRAQKYFQAPIFGERFTPNAHVWAGFFQPCKRKNFASTTFWRKVYTKRSILARVLAAVQRKNCTSTHVLAKGLHKTLTLGPGSCSRLAQEFYKHPFSGERSTQNAHFWAGFLGACTILKNKELFNFYFNSYKHPRTRPKSERLACTFR